MNSTFSKEKYITKKYKGLSDFMINAPLEAKIQIFTEAAQRATKEQKKVLERNGTSLKAR